MDGLAKTMLDWEHQFYLSSGSNKIMPHMLYKDGITNLAEITAATHVGMMFTIVVLLLTEDGIEFFQRVRGEEQAKSMWCIFQLLLSYWSWLKRDTHSHCHHDQ